MIIKIFCHSLVSDWNHGNAHFLRGITSELLDRGHQVDVFEPSDSWSRQNLVQDRGPEAIEEFKSKYPTLSSVSYDLDSLDLSEALMDADLVLVHEWNEPRLVKEIGLHRVKNPSYHLLFHDTHHRSATERSAMEKYDLSNYDGVLAFGEVIKNLYLERGWAVRAWTWHEAADTRVFRPIESKTKIGDLVWIGNWGDEERTAELHEFLLNPVKSLGLKATVYGVRYPKSALEALREAGIGYGGSLPNYDVPAVFSQYRVTVHVPRRPYARVLPGIPTIRIFEALACGIPLVSAPWNDAEKLFCPGRDFAVARTGSEMAQMLKAILANPDLAKELSICGLDAIYESHTCAHRVDELLEIVRELDSSERLRRRIG